jgi:hypothetical protein
MTFCRDLSVSRGVASDREHSLAFTRSGEVVEGIGTLPINRHHSIMCVQIFSLEEVRPKTTMLLRFPARPLVLSPLVWRRCGGEGSAAQAMSAKGSAVQNAGAPSQYVRAVCETQVGVEPKFSLKRER